MSENQVHAAEAQVAVAPDLAAPEQHLTAIEAQAAVGLDLAAPEQRLSSIFAYAAVGEPAAGGGGGGTRPAMVVALSDGRTLHIPAR